MPYVRTVLFSRLASPLPCADLAMRPISPCPSLCLQLVRQEMLFLLPALCVLNALWIPSISTSEIDTPVTESNDSSGSTDQKNLVLNLIHISSNDRSKSPKNSSHSSIHQEQDENQGYSVRGINNISTLHTNNSSFQFTSITSVLQYNVTVATPVESSEIPSANATAKHSNKHEGSRNISELSDLPSEVRIFIEQIRSNTAPENTSALAEHLKTLKDRLQTNQPPRKLAILDEILKGYDKREWPTYGTDSPTAVEINMYINTLGPVNAANMEFNMDIYLRMAWRDPRLQLGKFGIKKVLTMNAEEMAHDIWKPDIFFRNVKRANFHKVTVPNKLIKLSPNGEVLYSLRLTLVLSCQMSFRHYPLDTQQCHVILGPYAQTIDQVKIEWRKHEPIMIEQALELPEFDVANMSYSRFIREVDTGDFSFLNVTFVLVRQNGFHIIQTYLPTFLLVMISWVSFWLNVDATPARVTLGVTTLLTLTTVAYGVRMQLPPVSYVKAIDIWIGACSVFVFGALLEFTLVNYLSRSKLKPQQFKNNINIFHWTKKVHMQDMEDNSKSDSEIARNMKRARYVDRFSRIFFPVIFFIFNVIYWLYYLYIPDSYQG